MASKEAQEFIRIISSQLCGGDVPHPLDDRLKGALLESVTTLPEGGLRDELSKNIDVYFRKLKRSMKAHWRRSVGKATMEQPAADWQWNINTLTPRGLESALARAKEMEDEGAKSQMYQTLVVATLNHVSSLSSVLDQWSEELINTSSHSVSLDAVRFCSCLAGSRQSFLPWLQFCFRVYSQLVERALHSDEPMRDPTGTLKASLFGTLVQAHFRNKRVTSAEVQEVQYNDLVAALLSLYIDVTVFSATKSISAAQCAPDHLHAIVFTLLGHSHEHCLDAVLQTTTSLNGSTAAMLLPVMRKLLHSGSRSTSPLHYIKSVCCFHKALALAQASSKDTVQLQQLAFQLPAPSNLKRWLWRRNPSTCESTGLKRSWSQERTVKHLVQKISLQQVEELLDMAIAEGANEGGGQTEGGEEAMFFVDVNKESPQVEFEASSSSEDELENLIGLLPLLNSSDDELQGKTGYRGGLNEVEDLGTGEEFLLEKPSASELEFPEDVRASDVEVTASIHSAEPCIEQEWGVSFYEDKLGHSQCVTESDRNTTSESEDDLMTERLEVSDDRDRETHNAPVFKRKRSSAVTKGTKKRKSQGTTEQATPKATYSPNVHHEWLTPMVLRSTTRKRTGDSDLASLKTPDITLLSPLKPQTTAKKGRKAFKMVDEHLTLSVPAKRHSKRI